MRRRVYGRVLSCEAGQLQIGCSGEIHTTERPTELALQPGDLVRLEGGRVVEKVARNESGTPLHEQDWWRLQRMLPNLRQRHRILHEVRAWFVGQGFLEVEAPLMTDSPCPELHIEPVEVRSSGERRWLTPSPELHLKRLLSSGIDRVFYLGRAFRDGERGAHHHPEFTILEWYRAGEGTDALMSDVESLVALAFGLSRQWTRISVAEALARFAEPAEEPDEIIRHLVERVEPELARMGAVFLTDYPASLASLARLNPEAPHLAERFEAYVDGVELANGFGELTDALEQRARFESDVSARSATGRAELPLPERFIDALSAGLPPCAGIALGLDRLVMLAVGAESIDDVVLFSPEIS